MQPRAFRERFSSPPATEYATGSIPRIAYRPSRPDHPSGGDGPDVLRVTRPEVGIAKSSGRVTYRNGFVPDLDVTHDIASNRHMRTRTAEDRERDLQRARTNGYNLRSTISDTGAEARPTCRRRPTCRPSQRIPPVTRAKPPGNAHAAPPAHVSVFPGTCARPTPHELLKTVPVNPDGAPQPAIQIP